MMMGLPGSGKTQFAKGVYKSYTYINQDEIGSKEETFNQFIDALEANENIVLDRCNICMLQRADWLQLVLGYNVDDITCMYLYVPEDECLNRILDRKNHPVIKEHIGMDRKKELIETFSEALEVPEIEEGFTEIIWKKNY